MSSTEPPTSDELLEQLREDPDGFLRDNHAELEAVAERDDRLGALAQITIDLANGDHPSDDDLERLGVDPPMEADR